MDLAFDDMYMYGYWLVLDINRGRGHFFKFSICSNDFITQKVYFSCVGVYLVQVSLLLIGQ
jgi:hypothetical protein